MKLFKNATFTIVFALALIVLGNGCQASKSPPSPQLSPSSHLSTITPTTVAVSTVVSAKHLETTSVEFQVSPANPQDHSPSLEYEIPRFKEYEGDGEAYLEAALIYAIDQNVVFVGGSLSFASNESYERSILLRSADGGMNWTETLSTTIMSQVNRVAFIGQGEGWALVEGRGESGSLIPSMLWHTTNYGEDWQVIKQNEPEKVADDNGLSDIPKCIWPMQQSFKFYNSKNGEMGYVCRNAGPVDYFAIYATQDGGQTWSPKFYNPLPPRTVEDSYSDEELLAAFAIPNGGRYGSHAGFCHPVGNDDDCKAYGQDGSEWRINRSEDDLIHLIVYRRLPTEDEWNAYKLPSCFEYQQGKMIGPCEQSSP